MKKYFAYIRVSSRKQEEGASLPAQKKAIFDYAQKNNIEIAKLFKDVQSAGKSGHRKNFNLMVKELRGRPDITGIIMHKIDRSARNLRDWASLGDLIDTGVDVRFAHENLDVRSRGGRLAADIQAVVAADYLRNLTQEVKKGQNERLENGLYPFGAPIGYKDAGPGKPKTIDPQQAPLVKKCFELYLTREWTLLDLTQHLRTLGLKSSRGNPVNKNSMSKILNNPFYAGIIRIKGKTFKGAHKPLITVAQFRKTQKILQGRYHQKVYSHYYIFKGMLSCGFCGSRLRSMFAKKKYHYYYCRDKQCQVRCVNEKKVEKWLKQYLRQIAFTKEETEMFKQAVKVSRQDLETRSQSKISILNAQKEKVKKRLGRLMDLLIDQKINDREYQAKKAEYVFKLKKIQEQISAYDRSIGKTYQKIENFGKLMKSPYLSYKTADLENKRRLAQSMVENFSLYPEKLVLAWKSPFNLVAKRTKFTSGGANRDRWKTFRNLVWEIYEFFRFNSGSEVPLEMEVGGN